MCDCLLIVGILHYDYQLLHNFLKICEKYRIYVWSWRVMCDALEAHPRNTLWEFLTEKLKIQM
jgi:hypothetical protein